MAPEQLGDAAKQVNAKNNIRMAGWREEHLQEGVVCGWTVRKVNSGQKDAGKRKSFAQKKQFAGP
jgi:hypothetical protein